MALSRSISIEEELQNRAQKAFSDTLDFIVRQLSDSYPSVAAKVLGKGSKGYVLVDVGSGAFPYGRSLLEWTKSRHEKAKVFAVDIVGRELVARYPQVKFVPGRIEQAKEALEKDGVKKVNLFTMFNPNPGIVPNPLALGQIAADAPLVVALPNDGVVREANLLLPQLQVNGYSLLVVIENPFKLPLRDYFGYQFSPLVVAVSRGR